jgi:hypothetical protein
MNRTLAAALESIDFQGGAFYAELTAAFEALSKMTDAQLRYEGDDPDAAHLLLTGIVRQHTGLNVKFILADYYPCVMIPEINRNNVLINDFTKNFLDNKDGIKFIKEAKGFARGSVNLKTGRVTGVFTELVSTIYLPVKMIRGSKYTPGENAAVTLHEVGHLFTYYEFISRTVRTNQVLAGVTRALDQSSTQKDREAVLMTAKQALDLKDMDAAEVAKITNAKVVEVVIITSVVKETRSEIGTNLYDSNNFEFLADQFASRQGASRDLVTALDKLHREFGVMAFRSQPFYILMEAVKLVLFVGGLATIASVGWPAFALALTLMANDAVGDPTYDRPEVRLKRIRNDLIERSKQKDLAPGEDKQIKEDLVAIEKILEGVKDRFQLIGYVTRYVFGLGRARFEAEALQQELESFVANNLFGRADDLKALA